MSVVLSLPGMAGKHASVSVAHTLLAAITHRNTLYTKRSPNKPPSLNNMLYNHIMAQSMAVCLRELESSIRRRYDGNVIYQL